MTDRKAFEEGIILALICPPLPLTVMLGGNNDPVVINGIKLLTSDGYTLKDANGLYIAAKDGE